MLQHTIKSCREKWGEWLGGQVSWLWLLGLAVACAGCEERLPEIPRANLLPLEAAFSVSDEVHLSDVLSANVNDILVAETGDFFVADHSKRQVLRYSSTGQFLNAIGTPGFSAGEMSAPIAVDSDATGNLHILDYAQSRVHTFTPEGTFIRAIPYAHLGVTAFTLVVGPDGQIYIGGVNRVKRGEPNLPMIHRLASSGQPEASFYPMDSRTEPLNLMISAGVQLTRGPNGTIYAGQQLSARVSQFSPAGELIGVIGREAPFYRPPVAMPKMKAGTFTIERGQEHLRRWTQLSKILVLHGGEVLVAHHVSQPDAKYAIDIFAEDGGLLVGAIGSQMSPVAVGVDGSIWWRDPRTHDVVMHRSTWLQATAAGSRAEGIPALRLASTEEPIQ